MTREPVTAEFRELVERFLNGEATAAEGAQLETALLASKAARDFYLDYLNLHSALRRRFFADELPVLDESSDTVAPDRTPPLAPSAPASFSVSPVMLASAVVVALCGIFGYWYWTSLDSSIEGIATIRSLEGEVSLVSARETKSAKVGDSLRGGESLQVADDSARACLEYPDGTQVRVHSTSVVQAPAGRGVRLRLLSGSIEVESVRKPQDSPLVFATEHSRYLVLDTRFRLYREEASTRLELDKGKVQVERPAGGQTVVVDEGSVATVGDAQTPVDIQPLATGRAEPLRTLPRAGQRVLFSPDGESVLTSSWESGLKRFRRGETKPAQEYRADAGASDGLELSPDGATLIQVNHNGYVLAWNSSQSTAIKIPLPGRQTRRRAVSGDGSTVVESAVDGTRVFSIDLQRGTRHERLHFKSPGKAWCLALSRDGGRLAAGFWDGTLQVRDVATGETLFDRKLQHTPTHVELSADGGRLVVFTQRDGIKWIDIAAGEQHLLWPAGLASVRCLQFSPDGQLVLAGMNDGTARMWSVADGRQLLVVEAGHSPQGIAWLAKEQILATADGSVKLWKCTFDHSGKVVE